MPNVAVSVGPGATVVDAAVSNAVDRARPNRKRDQGPNVGPIAWRGAANAVPNALSVVPRGAQRQSNVVAIAARTGWSVAVATERLELSIVAATAVPIASSAGVRGVPTGSNVAVIAAPTG